MLLSESELERLHFEASRRCRLSCDEFHAHSAKCLVGLTPADEDAVTISKLVDHATQINGLIRTLFIATRQLPRPSDPVEDGTLPLTRKLIGEAFELGRTGGDLRQLVDIYERAGVK